MWVLNQELDQAALDELVITQWKREDVLFYSYLRTHAGSKNTSSRPRLAFNYKW
jgi:ectoine hydroxylase-related dioxygenase (phytanoyl-CoA dioxygenase family)